MQQQVAHYNSATDETWFETGEVPDPEPAPEPVVIDTDLAADLRKRFRAATTQGAKLLVVGELLDVLAGD